MAVGGMRASRHKQGGGLRPGALHIVPTIGVDETVAARTKTIQTHENYAMKMKIARSAWELTALI